MFSRIYAITQAINQLAQVKEFNNALPVLLKVLKRESQDIYSIKIGNLTQQTKSLKELQIGGRYFANLTKSSAGTTLLSHLMPYPEKLDFIQDTSLKFKPDELKNLLSHKNFALEYRDFLTQHFLHAPNRLDFLFYGNLLLALQKGIYHFTIHENKKDKVLQIRRKHKTLELEFFAFFPNLSSLSGAVYQDDEGLGLRIYTHFQNVKLLLERHLPELKPFYRAEILITDCIPEIFSFEERLLNIKG